MTASSPPSMRDVAEAAGVSVTTVSRVLRENAIPTQETRQRVLAAVRALNYQLPPRRRSKTPRSRQAVQAPVLPAIAFLTATDVGADIHGDFDQHEKLIRGLQKTFETHGYRFYYGPWSGTAEDWPLLFEDPNIAGAVIHAPVAPDLEKQFRPHLPVVYLDKPHFDRPGDLALCSITHAIRRPLQYLKSLGHQRIALFVDRNASYYREVFLAESARLGMSVDAALQQLCEPRQICNETYHPVLEAFTDQLIHTEPRPTAVLLRYRYALGLVETLQHRSFCVPDDLSVIGLGDRLLNYMRPPITAYDWPMEELGRSAAELLISRIQNPERPWRHLAVRGQLIERASCAPPPEA